MTGLAPAYFISHGAPDNILRDIPATGFWRTLPLPHTQAILVISAHWMTESPAVTATAAPKTIHDFGGFPDELYTLRYPAAGNPDLAAQIVETLRPVAPDAHLDPTWGYDHGAWVPLMLMRPAADIPVLQLSIQPRRDAAYHYALGQALAGWREQGVAIMASGSATHNLRAIMMGRYKETPPEVTGFNDWLHTTLTARDDKALLGWENAPHALWNHPTPDHILPLFTVLGETAGEKTATRIHHSFDYAVLSMDCYCLA